MITSHLDTEHIEISIGRLNGWRLLAVQENRFDDGHVHRVGQQVPSRGAVTAVRRVVEVATDFRPILASVRVERREFGAGRGVPNFGRIHQRLGCRSEIRRRQ